MKWFYNYPINIEHHAFKYLSRVGYRELHRGYSGSQSGQERESEKERDKKPTNQIFGAVEMFM